MRRIRVTEHAQADLSDIAYYTKQHWGAKQAQVVRRLFEQTFTFIKSHPHSGNEVPVPNTYKKVVTKIPFLVIYEVHTKEIIITKIIHTKRNQNI